MIARRPCNAHTYWGAIKGNLFTQKCCIHGFAIKLHLQRTPPFAGQQNYFHSCLTWVICCLSCVWVATWSPNLSFPQITNNPLFWLQTCSACRRWYVRNLTELWHYSHMAPVFLNQTTTPAWLCEHIIGQTKEQTFLACSSTSFIPQRSPPLPLEYQYCIAAGQKFGFLYSCNGVATSFFLLIGTHIRQDKGISLLALFHTNSPLAKAPPLKSVPRGVFLFVQL